MYSKIKKNEAIKLRKDGFSYNDISSKLNIAKSTLSGWLKHVVFIPNDLVIDRINKSNRKFIEIKRVDKLQSISLASDYANKNIGEISNRDLFMLGIGIYIGEGSKMGDFVRIANSDPRIIKFVMKWMIRCFDLTTQNFKIRIHTYPDRNDSDVIKFWMEQLGLSKESFYSSSLDRRSNKKAKNKNTLPYGTAHLSVVSNGDKNLGVLLHRKILASIDSVLR